MATKLVHYHRPGDRSDVTLCGCARQAGIQQTTEEEGVTCQQCLLMLKIKMTKGEEENDIDESVYRATPPKKTGFITYAGENARPVEKAEKKTFTPTGRDVVFQLLDPDDDPAYLAIKGLLKFPDGHVPERYSHRGLVLAVGPLVKYSLYIDLKPGDVILIGPGARSFGTIHGGNPEVQSLKAEYVMGVEGDKPAWYPPYFKGGTTDDGLMGA